MSIRMDSLRINASYTAPNQWMGHEDDDRVQLIDSGDETDGDNVSGSGTESVEDGPRNAGHLHMLTNITAEHVRIGCQRTTSVESSSSSSNSRPQIDSNVLKNSLEDIKVMLINHYMNMELPLVPWMADLVLPMEEYYFDLTLCQTDMANTNQPISITDIFKPVLPNRPSYRIVIEGGPGSGKSTFACKLAYDWARCEEYISMFELVFVINLRDLDMSLDAVLQEIGRVDDMDNNTVLSTIEAYIGRVLLILDGYDEVPQESRKYIIPLLRSRLYPRMTVVVTSKPSVVNRAFYQNKILTLQGFTEKQQKSFLQKYLSPEHNYQTVQENLQGIVTKNTRELFNCPMFLLLLASFASESDSKVIWTKTTLYKQLLNFLVRQGMHKSRCAGFYDLFSISQEDASGNIGTLLKFGKLALNTLKSDVLFFAKDDIVSCCGDEKILDYGFLKKYLILKKKRLEERFEPIHKSLAEFLAGFYLSYLAGTDWLLFEKEIHILNSSLDKYFMIIDFTAGLLELNSYKIFAALISNNFTDFGRMQKFISTLSECEVTEDLLKALVPLMPQIWTIPKRTKDSVFRGTNMHCACVRHGIRIGHVRAVACEATEFNFCYLPKDVEIPYLHLNFENLGMSKQNSGCNSPRNDSRCFAFNCDTKAVKCRELLCLIKCTPAELSGECLDLCTVISAINTTKVAFELGDVVDGKILPILQECFVGYKLFGLYNATMILSKAKSCILCNVKVIIDLMLSKKLEELSLCLVRTNNEPPRNISEVQTITENDDADDTSLNRFWRIFTNVKPRLKQLHNLEDEELEQEPAFVDFGRALISPQCYVRKLVLVGQGLDVEETKILSLCVQRSLRIQELYICCKDDTPSYFDLNVLCFEGSKTWKCLAFSNARLDVGQRAKELYIIKELRLLKGKDLGTCAEALTSCAIEKLVCDFDLLIEMFKLGVQNVNEYLTVRYFHLLTETRQWQTFTRLDQLSVDITNQKSVTQTGGKVICAIMSANLKTFEIRGWIENVTFVSDTFDILQKMHDSCRKSPHERRKSDPHVPSIQLEELSLFSTRMLLPEIIPSQVMVVSKLKSLVFSGNIKCLKVSLYSGLNQSSVPLQFAEALKSLFPKEEEFQISVDQDLVFDWEKKNVCPLSNNFYTIITVSRKVYG